ncbi:MAG: leucyl aminopeptidase, partial [bacterium]
EDAPLSGCAKELDKLVGGALGRLKRAGTFAGKEGEIFLFPTPTGSKAKFIAILGLGKQSDMKLNTIRNSGGCLVACAAKNRLTKIAIPVVDFDHTGAHDPDNLAQCALALTEGILLRDYEFADYKTFTKDTIVHLEEVLYAVPKGCKSSMDAGIAKGQIFAEATNFARNLVNHPPNTKTPTYLADRAREIAKNSGGSTTLKVFNRKECEKLGMGSFLSVAQGTDTEPQFIILEYKPKKKDAPTVALVGKAITFDTGGISLKPAQGMESMKYDMAGGAGVLGAMKAISELAPDVHVVGIVPSTDNMPSGKALHPSDIVRSQSGISIEIISTDAEGRLILADGLEYAQKFNPDACVDMATLTGAVVVALGSVNGGIMSNNPNLAKQLIRAGRVTNEKLWELPLDREYFDSIKTPVADVKNSGGREAGSITAGKFLEKFVGSMAWAHLDIAGMAWEERGRPYMDKGATGFGARLMTEFVLNFERPGQKE